MTGQSMISPSSDTGDALGLEWLSRGHEVAGTYRTQSVDEPEKMSALYRRTGEAGDTRPTAWSIACPQRKNAGGEPSS